MVTINRSIQKDVWGDDRSCILVYGQPQQLNDQYLGNDALKNQPQGSLSIVNHL